MSNVLALVALACHRPSSDGDDRPASGPPTDTGTTDPGPTGSTGDTGEPAIPPPCGTLASVELLGGAGDDLATKIGAGVDGSVYVVGSFTASIVFDAGGARETTLVAGAATGNGYLARYAPDGTFDWARGTSQVVDLSLAATSDGGVVAAGSRTGPLTLSTDEPDAITLDAIGSNDGVVARFGPDGALLWALNAGGGGRDYVGGLGILADDSVLLSGTFERRAVFGPGEPGETVLDAYPSAVGAGWVARLGPDGALLWATRFGGTRATMAAGAALDPATEELVVAGTLYGPGEAEFAALHAVPLGDGEVVGYMARWSADGEARWVTTHGGASVDVDVAGDGSALVVGTFDEEVVFGEGEAAETTLAPFGDIETFIARLDPDGALLWATQTRGGGNAAITTPVAVAADVDGGAVVGGYFIGGFWLAEPVQPLVTMAVGPDAWFGRYDAAGSGLCAAQIGDITNGDRSARSVVARPDGTWATTGFVPNGPSQFAVGAPEQTELEADGYDGFLATWHF